MAAAPDLGSGAARRGGSSPFIRTFNSPFFNGLFLFFEEGTRSLSRATAGVSGSPFIRTFNSPFFNGLFLFLEEGTRSLSRATAGVSGSPFIRTFNSPFFNGLFLWPEEAREAYSALPVFNGIPLVCRGFFYPYCYFSQKVAPIILKNRRKPVLIRPPENMLVAQ